jgi:AcrR family transcriptional regulator
MRRKLLRSAAQLFRKAGHDGVSVSAIARRAGVAKGTFFNYFPEKDDLLRALREDVLRPVGDLVVESRFRKMRPADRLRELTSQIASRVEGEPWLASLLAHAFVEPPKGGPEQGLRSVLVGIVKEGQVAGQLREEPRPDDVAETLLGVLAGAMGAEAGGGAADLGEQVATGVDLLLDGLRSRA